MTEPFANLQRGKYRVILADPPWQFNSLWGGRPKKIGNNYPSRAIDAHYDTMTIDEIAALPVARAPRPGWDVWGNQTDKFEEPALA